MKYFLILLLITANISIAQTSKPKSTDDISIINYTYNFEFDKADKLIDEGLKNFPESPKYYFLRIGTEMIKSMNLRDDAKVVDKQAITDSINNVIIPFAEAAIEKFEDNTKTLDDKFFLGCIYGYVGRIYGLQGSWMSAFSYVKDGQDVLEEVLEQDPTKYDAYLVLGMLNYFADRMGGVVGFVASILGLSGDREIGLEYLKIAEEKGYYTSVQAAYTLLELYSRLESNEYAGIPYFERFIKEFPKNSHIINWYCRELMDINRLDRVTEIINNDKYDVIDNYVLGRYYNKIGNYELSNKAFDKIRNNKDRWYHFFYDHVTFMYAQNCLMLNDENKLDQIKQELNENYLAIFNELEANKEATKQITKLCELVADKNNVAEINNILNHPPKLNGNDKFLKGMLDYYRGVSYFKLKDYTSAEKVFLSLRSEENNYFTVESVKYLLEIYSTITVDTSKAEDLVDFIDDMDNEALSFRAKDIECKYNL